MSDIVTTISQPASLQLTINPPAQTTTVLQVGQGPAGPRGETGALSGVYEHHQTNALDSWTVNHNLGYRPNVTILSVGGVAMLAEVQHLNTNQIMVYFDEPRTGLAVCS